MQLTDRGSDTPSVLKGTVVYIYIYILYLKASPLPPAPPLTGLMDAKYQILEAPKMEI